MQFPGIVFHLNGKGKMVEVGVGGGLKERLERIEIKNSMTKDGEMGSYIRNLAEVDIPRVKDE